MAQFYRYFLYSLIVIVLLVIYRQNNKCNNCGLSIITFNESSNVFIFFNRVPKCGSTTLNVLFRNQAKSSKGEFQFKLDDPTPPVELLSRKEVESFQSWVGRKLKETTIIFSRHIYYMDMSKFGGKVIYINQLRDPVDRFISGYNWRRYLAIEKGRIPGSFNQTATQVWLNKTLEECVMDVNDRECNDFSRARVRVSNLSTPWADILPSAVPYLCGMDHFCGSAASDEAADRAIHNIENHYLFVGILEKMEMTITVMKHFLPEVMKELSLDEVEHKNHHGKNDKLDPNVRRILQERMKGEYKVYRHAVQRLEKQYNHIQTTLQNK